MGSWNALQETPGALLLHMLAVACSIPDYYDTVVYKRYQWYCAA